MAEQMFLIGTYTTPMAHAPLACGGGILTVLISDDKTLVEIGRSGSEICGENPSYLAQAGKHTVYAVNEVAGGGTLSKLKVQSGGRLSKEWQVECGKQPAHVGVVGKGVVVGGFGDGCVRYFDEDGNEKAVLLVGGAVHLTLGVSGERVLVCEPVGGWVYLVKVVEGGEMEIENKVKVEGYPRHGVEHGGLFYVVCGEGRVLWFNQELEEVGRVEVGEGGKLGGIKSGGDRGGVLVSERREGEVGWIWRVKDGKVVEGMESGGVCPRDLEIWGEGVLVANQESGGVLGWRRLEGGKRGGVADVELQLGETGAPACLLKLV